MADQTYTQEIKSLASQMGQIPGGGGDIDMSIFATISYVDTQLADYLPIAGGTMVGVLGIAGTGVDRINFTGTGASDNRGLSFNSRTALSSDDTDGYLRLNNDSEFSNGVFTPGNMWVDGLLLVDGSRGLTNVTGTFGNVQTAGSGQGSNQGYSIDGRVVFMEDGFGEWHIYDDAHNKRVILGELEGGIYLFHDDALKLETTTNGIHVTGDLTATGEVEAYSTSDIRLKESLRDLKGVLEMVRKIKTVRYRHKEKNKEEIGVIAQDIQKYFPEVVKENDKGHLMVDYGRLVPVCIAAIKELYTKVNKN